MIFDGPYSKMLEGDLAKTMNRLNKIRNATVVHHETCPCCGAKLVNLYRREKEWRCRECWEKYDVMTEEEKDEAIMDSIFTFMKAQQEAEEAGQHEFTCPLCGTTAVWVRSPYNNHLSCGCKGCGFRLME